jgi:hypothetical protein
MPPQDARKRIEKKRQLPGGNLITMLRTASVGCVIGDRQKMTAETRERVKGETGSRSVERLFR